VLEEQGWLLCTGNTHHRAPRDFEAAVRKGRRIVTDLETFPMPGEFGREDYLKTVWAGIA
jgi:hypothetical protein